MHARRFRRRCDVDREVIRQRIDQRVETDQRLTKRGRIGGIDAARRDALRIDERERVFVAIEGDDVEIPRFTQQMRNALTDQSGADEGHFHIRLLYVRVSRYTCSHSLGAREY